MNCFFFENVSGGKAYLFLNGSTRIQCLLPIVNKLYYNECCLIVLSTYYVTSCSSDGLDFYTIVCCI